MGKNCQLCCVLSMSSVKEINNFFSTLAARWDNMLNRKQENQNILVLVGIPQYTDIT